MAHFRSSKGKMTSVSVAPVCTAALQSEDDLVSAEDDDTKSLLSHSTMTRSVHGEEGRSKDESKGAKVAVEYDIHCLCGFSNGVVESWVLSSNKLNSFDSAIEDYRGNAVSVSRIARIPQLSDNYVNFQNPNESIFQPFDDEEKRYNQGCFLVSYSDGLQCSLILRKDGTISRNSYFTLPVKMHTIITGYNSSVYEEDQCNMECILVSDLHVYETLLYCPEPSVLLPKWIRPSLKEELTGPRLSDDTSRLSTLLEKHRQPSALPLVRNDESGSEASPLDDGAGKEEETSQSASESREMTDSRSTETTSSTDSSPSSASASIERSSARNNAAVKALSYSPLQSPTAATALTILNQSQSSAAAAATANTSSSQAKEFIGNMESSQRIVSTELHFAKKDRKLLELFAKRDTMNAGTVSPAETVEIVFNWLNSVKVAKESIWELLKILEIKDSDRLKFIEVAKIAAVVSSALNKTLQEMGGDALDGQKKPSNKRRLKDYRKLKSCATKVTYNSMGEKVIEKMELPRETMGLFNGFVSTIRRIWDEESCRVITQSESREHLVKPLEVRLQHVPDALKKALKTDKVPLPSNWLPSRIANAHWFDPLRTIRIARTLMDIRSTQQHDALSTYQSSSSSSSTRRYDIESMEVILVKYFERNHGDKGLQVTPAKVVNFLEACLQYQHHPIVNILQGMLGLETAPTSPSSSDYPRELLDTAVWVCAEARSALCARGCVVDGALMQPYNSDFNYMETFVKDGGVWQVKWQLICRADAIAIVDELLRSRGKYGPAVYLHIFSTVESIPAIPTENEAGGGRGEVDFYSLASDVPLNRQMIDFECFLEALFFEFYRLEKLVLDAERGVFGEGAMSLAINTVSREINHLNTARRQLIIDDQDFQYGLHHEVNMRKIKQFLMEFIRHDSLRTGVVEQSTFEEVLRGRLLEVLKDDEENGLIEVHFRAFVRVVHKMFLEGSPTAPVSYIDLVATLLGWEFQCQGEYAVTFGNLARDISNMKRSIEQAYANELIKYFSATQHIQGLEKIDQVDPIWVMHPTKRQNLFSADPAQASLSLPTAGNWDLHTAAPSDIDNPVFTEGLNYSKKQLILGRPAVVVDKLSKGGKRQVRVKDAVAVPQILSSSRSLTTVHGETSAASVLAKTLDKCPITRNQITLNIAPHNPLQCSKKEVELGLTRVSFSRSVADIHDRSQVLVESFSKEDSSSSREAVRFQSQFGGSLGPETSFAAMNASDGSILLQLRSLLPPTTHLPAPHGSHPSPSPSPLAGHSSIHSYDVQQQPHQQGSVPSPPRTGSPHRLGLNSRSSLFSMKIESPNKDHGDSVELFPFLQSLDEGSSFENIDDQGAAVAVAMASHDEFETFPSPFTMQRPSSHGHTMNGTVFPSSSAGPAFSAFYGGGSISTENSMIESIAKEEVQNRLIRLRNRDQEFEKLFQAERDEFERRDREKRKLRKQIRQELNRKEKASMEFYNQSVEEKYRLAMKGKAQLDAALALEEEDKKLKELEIQKILNRNKERSLQLQEQKKEMKREEEDRKREKLEQTAMLKEDRSSAMFEKEMKSQAK